MAATADAAELGSVLKSTQPPDDSGAETADRYEWQAVMAAADVLSLYFRCLDEDGALIEGAQFEVLCEHHEDWSILETDGAELVSGKHREASVGPLSSLRQILDEGGVLHLFGRWKALDLTPLCRLVTTAGLTGDSAKLVGVCDRLRADPDTADEDVLEVIAAVKTTMASLLCKGGAQPAPEPDDVIRAFLMSLRVLDSQPRRHHVGDLAGERYGRPVADRLGQPTSGPAVWMAVLSLVRPRMRAAGPARGGALPTVNGVEHDDPLAPRTLSLADVDAAVRLVLASAADFVPLPRVILANRMSVKMTEGGCSDNAVERADRLRLQYRQYWRVRQSSPSTTDQRRQLDNMLLRILDDATDGTRVAGAQWGAELWREIDDRLQRIEGTPEAQGLSADLMLGGVSELANRCWAWFTDRFDADGRLAELKAGAVAR